MTAGALQTSLKESGNAFVSKLNAAGSALVYSTYLGGSGDDVAGAIAIDAAGGAYVAGITSSTDFPTTAGALQTSYAGGSDDAFVFKLAPLSLTAGPITATEGAPFTGVVGFLVDEVQAFDPAGNFTVLVAWGDGATSAATAVPYRNGFNLLAGHTYAEDGAYQPTVTVIDADGDSATSSGTANVTDAPLSGVSKTATFTEGAALSRTVASFEDADPRGAVGDYTASIDWGDETSSAGTVVADGAIFDVAGAHQYAADGSFPITVVVHDVGGATTFINSTAAVAVSPASTAPSLASITPSATVEGTFVLIVNGGSFAADAVVSLNGTPLATYFITAAQLKATVPASLAEEGTDLVTVSNPGPQGGTSSALPLVLNDAPLSAGGQPIAAVEGGLFAGVVATFTDPGGELPAANYSVLVNWGDGNSSQATLAPAGGGFNVLASHVYQEEGAYQATTTVVDDGGGTATAASTVTVADAALTAVGKSVAFTEGVPLSRVVASFEDLDPKSAAGDYTASIAWGDGSSSAGTVVADGALFDVLGLHQYSEEANHLPITVSIHDAGGATAAATSSADVGLSANGVSLAVTGNKRFNGTVAKFSDAGLSADNDFTAGINWGDGTSSTGTVTAIADSIGNYTVTGTHDYASFLGASAIVVTITDGDSGVVTVVADPLIDPLPAPTPTSAPAATPNQIYVLDAYQSAFGTAGTPATIVAGGSLADWAAKLDAGATRSSFATAMMHSDEYYGLMAGTVYQKYLGRAADAGGLAYWTGQLAQGADRAAVAQGFAASPEREAQRVQDDYFTYLGRSADAAGQTYWVHAFEQGMHNEDVIAGFLASDEYYQSHSA